MTFVCSKGDATAVAGLGRFLDRPLRLTRLEDDLVDQQLDVAIVADAPFGF